MAARANRTLGDRRVLVISNDTIPPGMPNTYAAMNHGMHAEIAALSTRGRHMVFEAPTISRY
jgi:hypothetical protein